MATSLNKAADRLNPIDPETVSLQQLISPFDRAAFIDQYWEKDILVVERAETDYLSRLLTMDDIDRVITTLTLHNDAISLVNAKQQINAAEYCFSSGMVDPARLYGFFADGATIIMPQLHLRVGSLADLVRAMEAEMGHRFQTNIYVTPPGESQGFKPHFDSHDVFVLQVSGSKKWKIYDTPIALPDRNIRFDADGYELGAVTREFTLHAGEVAYVPRGVVHDAVSTDELSVHITLGALVKTWADTFKTAIDAMNLRAPELRESLPIGYHKPGADRAVARTKAKALVEMFAEWFDADTLLDDFAQELLESRHGLLRGQLAQTQALETISADTFASARPNLIYEITTDDDGVGLYCYGQELRFPAHAQQPLTAALQAQEYRIGDLPGDLDEAGKCVLVKRLVREGLVRLTLSGPDS